MDDKSHKEGHVEAWAPLLLQRLVAQGKDGLSGWESRWAAWAPRHWSTGALLGSGSWNHSVMAAACQVWLDGGGPALDWLLDLLRFQVGEKKPAADEAILGRLMGTETGSTTYWPFLIGSFAGVRILAQKLPGHPLAAEVMRLTGRYFETSAAVLALGAVPWWDQEGHRGSHGPYYDGPTVAAVGERSTPAHAYQSDLGPALALLTGWRLNRSKHEDWPGKVLRLVARPQVDAAAVIRSFVAADGRDPSSILSLLHGVSLATPMHWMRWPSGLLVFKEHRINFNTECVPWSWASNSTRRMAFGNPFLADDEEPSHGGARAGAGGPCETVLEEGRAVARAEGREAVLDLPAGPPLWHVVGDENGFRAV